MLGELGDRELAWGESKAEVGVREFGAQTLASLDDYAAVVEGGGGQAVDGVPPGVGGKRGLDVARHEPEVGRRELPALGVAIGLAQGRELLEPRELAHVDLHRQMSAHRLLEGFRAIETATR